MSVWGKLAGVTAGYLVGGIFGAVVGAVAGHYVLDKTDFLVPNARVSFD